MNFRSLDKLRVFDAVARHQSISIAAEILHLTKSAVSYQIKKLEEELGFSILLRQHNKVSLNDKGRLLWQETQTSFASLEKVIDDLRNDQSQTVTVGMSTYFASRWLSPRLMKFTSRFPHIVLRLQPITGFVDLERAGLDALITWGKGGRENEESQLLFNCPAIPTAGKSLAASIKGMELCDVIGRITLLHDYEGSPAWKEWHKLTGIEFVQRLNGIVIHDPNVRVQAVIDGQGLALNDSLVNDEIKSGKLVRISSQCLDNYGYHIVISKKVSDPSAVDLFRNWILNEAQS